MIPSDSVRESLRTTFRTTIWEPFCRAMETYHLLAEGDRIAVCISGGKDSSLLALLMEAYARESPVPFECVNLIMDPGYRPEIRSQVEENARRLSLSCTLFESDIFQVASSQTRNPCFLCARMRRGCLYEKARSLGCNKIALGHHFDDVIETTVMAMLYGAQLQAMPPILRARNFPGMQLIRPLYQVHESSILAWCRVNDLHFIRCACRLTESSDSGRENSKRLEIKNLLKSLEEDFPGVRERVFQAIHHLETDSMVAVKQGGITRTVLPED